MRHRSYRRNDRSSTIKIKFTLSALQTYFELVDEFDSTEWSSGVLYAAFAEHIDLYRALDQREMFIISTEGDFGGGTFNIPLERATGAAFASTSIEDVVKFAKRWKDRGRLVGDLYVLEVDGFGRRFSHFSSPKRLGIDTSNLTEALNAYHKGEISMGMGIEMSGLLDQEFSVPSSELCTIGLGCSILLKEWDTFKVYKVVDGGVEQLKGIPETIQFPLQKVVYAIADSDAETLQDLMRDGVWGRGVYVLESLDAANQEAERLGLDVYEVGLTLPDHGLIFELGGRNVYMSSYGSSLKRGMDGDLNAFLMKVTDVDSDNMDESESYFVSRLALGHEILDDYYAQEELVEQALEWNDIESGSQGEASMESWLEAVGYGEIDDIESYEDLVSQLGSERKADTQLLDTYYRLLCNELEIPQSARTATQLSDTSKVGAVISKKGYAALQSNLGSQFDNYLYIPNPEDVRSRVIIELDDYR